MTRFLYTVFGIAVLGVFAYAALQGREMRTKPRTYMPLSVRGSSGGYRSYWYSGFHGGK